MNPIATVLLVLESWPEARDDEGMLISSVWSNELEEKHIKISKMKTFEFMTMLMEGKLTSASAILAIRDKLQAKHLELRGETFVPTVGLDEY